MKKLLTTTAVLVTLTMQATAAEWWKLSDLGFGDKFYCFPKSGSPAETYEEFQLATRMPKYAEKHRNPRIVDKGDEADVVTDGGLNTRYFRTEAGCLAAAKPLQEAADKAAEVAKEKKRVEQQKLEKYR